MELELLMESWKVIDKKIQKAAVFNHKLLERIIASRVTTTVGNIKRLYSGFYVVLSVELIFLTALFAGNPFDFKYDLQFVPYALLSAGVVIAFINLIHIDRSIHRLSPDASIGHYLRSIVSIYNRNKRFEKWFGTILFSIGLLVPISFLPQKIERYGVTRGLLDCGIMISVTLILYIIAFKLGAFKNHYKDKLERDLAEWEELKTLASEIDSE